nr:hypothetical protein [uncultured Rhodoferax sp.]
MPLGVVVEVVVVVPVGDVEVFVVVVLVDDTGATGPQPGPIRQVEVVVVTSGAEVVPVGDVVVVLWVMTVVQVPSAQFVDEPVVVVELEPFGLLVVVVFGGD